MRILSVRVQKVIASWTPLGKSPRIVASIVTYLLSWMLKGLTIQWKMSKVSKRTLMRDR